MELDPNQISAIYTSLPDEAQKNLVIPASNELGTALEIFLRVIFTA